MRNRLVELIGKARQSIRMKTASCGLVRDMFFAEYLLEHGVIVPPCKVGDTVYRIVEQYNNEIIIVDGMVFEFAITHESSKRNKYRFYFLAKADKSHTSRQYSIWCEFADFGKTVFFTQKEAEQALKGNIEE